ncbi:MAG: metallophosphoesterase [Verrucomicrobia bacterium]|nr:metallophosphoesterase [Verrucomicrobiota bacterium]MCG2681254.1 metallophosphoesterase [Kiritimatiellia bacterium]MBU4246922.1 metallophosphoesterase [Verrucomicrobiota bacterium]MBU4291590.1 metallophosphoesterase [Verrucomicrobiota bacterium]MBU4428309.1 metallophosphoesterase [Verrucomicrobiota bacterium]
MKIKGKDTSTGNNALTFFVWADMHFGYNQQFGERDLRWQAIRQMNKLAGWPYPKGIGGCVETPSLILVCGDFIDGGSDGERNFAYYQNSLRQTDLPSYEAMGNHDIQYQNAIDYFNNRYGNLYYSFNHQGVHFVALCQTFDQAENVEALNGKQIEWLAKDLAALKEKTPVVIFAHDDPDRLPNAKDLYAVISKSNVILTFSGHYHGQNSRESCAHTWHGIKVVTTGHVRNHPIDRIFGRYFLVVRIMKEEILVAPWRWDLEEWACRQGDVVGPEHVVIK